MFARSPLTPTTLRYWAPYLVLFSALVFTALATLFVQRATRSRQEMRFGMAVEEVHRNIEHHMRTNVSLLQGTTGLFAASGEIDIPAFRRYVDRLNHENRYRGSQGIGFTMRIDPGDEGRIEAEMRRHHHDFHLWNDDPTVETHAILYLEPLDTMNRRAIGYNMFSEPVRRAAMEMARDTGWAATTGRVRLKQEGDEGQQNGFLVYVPVYRNGDVPRTVEARRRDLVGFVYSPFRMDDFIREAFENPDDQHVMFDIWDGPITTADHLLYRAPLPPGHARTARLTTRTTIQVPGRGWRARFDATEAFHEASDRATPPLTLVTGVTISVLLFGISMVQARSRDAAERATADLRRSEEAVRSSQEELRRLYRTAQEARAAAEEANRLKDEFLATVSHELRTPLNAIMGYAQLLRMGRSDPESTRRALEAIERNVKSQAQLIEDLLDVSRIISGQMRLEVERVDLEQVCRQAMESVAPAAAAKNIRVTLDVAPDAGPILGDPNRLQQVVWNLLSNAIKFTESGGSVAVRAERSGDHVAVSVKDTGSGIPPEHLLHIFDRFRQMDSSTTRRHGGLGLGLSIVRNIVEHHGGTVHAESEGVGKGSTFIFRLPVSLRDGLADDAPAARPPSDTAGPRAGAQPDAPDFTGLRVVVVDDEPDARVLVREILQEYGAEVRAEGSAADGLEAVRSFRPDLLLCDIAMPGEDGYSLIQKVRALSPEEGGEVRAAALTAFTRAEDRRRALLAGFHMHIPKPLDPQNLIRVVAGLTGRDA